LGKTNPNRIYRILFGESKSRKIDSYLTHSMST
jgi:hypothetical protein